MYKYILFFIAIFFLSQCSLDTKSGFWTKSEVQQEQKDDLEKIFKSENVLKNEFNPNLKIKIKTSYQQNPFVNNLSNNSGYINFESNFEKISKFKFKKIKHFNNINPDLLIGRDNSLIFFNEKGTILKFDQESKLIWD